MKCCHVEVYLAGKMISDHYQVRAASTFDSSQERQILAWQGYDWYWPLTGLISLSIGYQLLLRLHQLPESGWPKENFASWIKKVRRWLSKEKWLRKMDVNLLSVEEPEKLTDQSIPLINPIDQELLGNIAFLLRGKNLYYQEICRGLEEICHQHFSGAMIQKTLQFLLITGKIEMVPANLFTSSQCLRCEHDELELTQCGICQQPIGFCSECNMMGESLSCRPLFRRMDRALLLDEDRYEVTPYYTYPLTPYQKEISLRLETVYLKEEPRKWLLWAVCGAGKTETTFGVMGQVLRRGGRILFTSPRREVIRQMEERLGMAFPQVRLIGLYGGSKSKLAQAPLVTATIHQLARFYQAFDLIIFDEVDAFPYQGDARLQRLLERSLKKTGRLIYLSATPGQDLIQEVKKGTVGMLTLPARFHRQEVPLPMIQIQPLPRIPDFRALPRSMRHWLVEDLIADGSQLFIFLPTRKMVESFGQSFQAYLETGGRGQEVHYTHSQDPERSKKVKAFLTGQFPILVSSTILERGVTVPKSNVVVLYADYEEIFNYQSLIQMAGRAGRSLKFPDGQVHFIARKKSQGMKRARLWIKKLNQLAVERGLLDVEKDKK